MGARGRKSSADLSVIPKTNVVSIERPLPPPGLTEEQADEWRAVVGRMAADWFPRETHGMLVAFCRHVVAARRVAQLIEAAESAVEFDLLAYDRLLKCQERESRCVASLSVKMRISQSTAYDKTKKRSSQVKRPWEG